MMVFDYGEIRKLQAMIIYLNFRWGLGIDKYLTDELCDPNHYRMHFDNAMKKGFPDPQEREEKEKEATKFFSAILLDDKYFRWMIDDERMACFCWLYIQLGLGWEKPEANLIKCDRPNEESIPPEYERNAYLLLSGFKSHEINWGNVDYTLGSKSLSDLKFIIYHKLLYCNFKKDASDGFSNVSEVEKIKKFSCNDFIRDRSDYLFSVMKCIDESRVSLVKKRQCLENTQRAWRRQYNNFPSPFDWVSDKNEEQCLWVWEYMKKNYIWVDVKPTGIKQLRSFLTGVFDVWQGWTQEQLNIINKKNDENERHSRVKESDFINLDSPIPDLEIISDIRHKEIFLKDIKNAWAQKTYRDKRNKKRN
ncbi:hypothetical protein H5A21_19395 [Pectobacterium aquaticum]|nr:hypothetical protein [Pectobacterium aquaticum]MBN3066186.1 hypothetical protein [Pectobacterium aquaticum]